MGTWDINTGVIFNRQVPVGNDLRLHVRETTDIDSPGELLVGVVVE